MADESARRGGAAWWIRGRVVLYFLLGLVVLDVFVAAYQDVWSEFDPENYRWRLEDCRCQPRDLVVVGGSPAACGFDPSILAGLPWRGRALAQVYNLALPLGTTSEVWLAVEHGLAAPPRLLVYGICATDLNDDRVVAQGPRALMNLRDLAHWVQDRPDAAPWCLRHFVLERCSRLWHLYHDREGIRLWTASQIERLWPGACPEAAAEAARRRHYRAALHWGHGFVMPPDSPHRRLDYLKQTGAPEVAFFPFLDNFQIGGHLASLYRLLDWAASHQVPLVLVDMPVSADLDERRYPQIFASYRQLLAELERARGVRVLRPSRQAVGLDDTSFSDLIHLNARGSARLSRWLRGALTQLDADSARAG